MSILTDPPGEGDGFMAWLVAYVMAFFLLGLVAVPYYILWPW